MRHYAPRLKRQLTVSESKSQIELTLQKVTKKGDFRRPFTPKRGYAEFIQRRKDKRGKSYDNQHYQQTNGYHPRNP
ncbi:protein of unknown function [Serratia sp. Tan611]|nr:protein of unknown function [Serratia sp. Tan611]